MRVRPALTGCSIGGTVDEELFGVALVGWGLGCPEDRAAPLVA